MVTQLLAPQLPPDLVGFHENGCAFEYDPDLIEVGMISLYPLEDIELREFGVNSRHDAYWANKDPHRNEPGYYVVPAYDLVMGCKNHAPRGVLIYIPSLGVYGQYDDDHSTITYFPKICWWNIVGDPRTYLNGQWTRERFRFNPRLNPVGHFEYRADWRKPR